MMGAMSDIDMNDGSPTEARAPLAERFTQLSTLGEHSDEQRIATFQSVLDALQRELDETSR